MLALHHLIYMSESTQEMNPTEIDSLIKLARFNNFTHGVTGLLLYGEQKFIQILEGQQDNVAFIFEKILMDKRHHSIKVVANTAIEKRMFTNWNMGLILFAEHPNLIEQLSQQSANDIQFTSLSHYNASYVVQSFSHENFMQLIR